jgi:signal transduction histidine kinase
MRSRIRRGVRAALAVPLFWKIIGANAAVVLAAAVLGAVIHTTPGTLAALAVGGVSLSLLVNGAILRVALKPLDLLQRAAARVQDGDLNARAPASPLADPAMRRLGEAFNAALDGLAAARRRVRLLLAHSMEIDESERRRVAHALENDVAQRLAGLLMRLRLLERQPGQDALARTVEESSVEIGRALDIMRSYAGTRRPAVLEELGLVAALQAEARRLREEGDVVVRVSGYDPKGLSFDAELALYRILKEAMENAARHARARSVHLRVSNGGSKVHATVEDDGRGFDPASVEDGAGLGLAAMRERTESLGGRFCVWSAPGEGTRVQVEFPA